MNKQLDKSELIKEGILIPTKNEALKTYKELIERKAIYNYIAEADISYWWDYAKEEDYDTWLADKCEDYGIEVDYMELEEHPPFNNYIYELEKKLEKKLEDILLKEVQE